MKKHIYIVIGIILISAFIVQGQTGLTFRLVNPKIEYSEYLSFTIETKASASGTFLYAGQATLNFNSNILDPLNSGWSAVKTGSGLLDGTFFVPPATTKNKYNIITEVVGGIMNISWVPAEGTNSEAPSSTHFNEVPNSWTPLVIVYAKIVDSNAGVVSLNFLESGMNNQQFYHSAANENTLYSTVNFDDDFTNLYVGRIYSNSIWTQIGGTEDWSNSVNTSVWDGAATIPTSGESSISTLRIHNGATLTVPATGKLTVSGTSEIIPSSDGLIVESNSTTTGSVIFEDAVSGNVTYSRYVTGVAGLTDNWHFVTSTSTDQTIANFISGNSIEKIGTKNGFAPYNNLSESWDYFDDSSIPTTAFPNGKGYEILSASTGNILFKGNPLVTDYTTAITSPAEGNNWNLVGNSYLSAIHAKTNRGSVNDFLNENALKLNENYRVIYMWNAATGNYEIINQISGDNYIAPGQAFFVYAKEGSNLDFTTSMRTHQPSAVFKNGTIANPHIKLFAENKDRKINAEIFYLDAMTTGLDPGYDAGRFGLSDNSFAIYTKLLEGSDVDFAIQCLPNNDYESFVIPIGLNAKTGSEVTFKVETDNLPVGINVYLEDKLTGTYTKLNLYDDFYTVTLSAESSGAGRFFLHTKEQLTNLEYQKIYFSVNPILKSQILQITGSNLQNNKLRLIGIDGKILNEITLQNQTQNEIFMNGFKPGVYIIQLENKGKVYREKFVWF